MLLFKVKMVKDVIEQTNDMMWGIALHFMPRIDKTRKAAEGLEQGQGGNEKAFLACGRIGLTVIKNRYWWSIYVSWHLYIDI